jgi:TusA-related sulfurtransferase
MGYRHLDLATAEEGCGDNALGRVRRAFEGLDAGEFLEVLTTVPEQAFAVRVWTRRAGGAVIEETRQQGRTRIVLRRQGP